MKTIKAECLQWMPRLFGFEADFEPEEQWEGLWDYVLMGSNEKSFSFIGEDQSSVRSFEYSDYTVQVNPTDYTHNTIAFIKRVIPDVQVVEKKNGVVTAVGWYEHTFTINIDPQPWLESYTVEVE